LLDPREREVVLGDLAETGACGADALRGVLGLVIRRQAALWLDWRPWFAVGLIVVPIGVMLSHASRYWGESAAENIRHYWILWDFSYLGFPGWRADLIRTIAGTGIAWLALFGWSWTSGFVIGRVSRRAIWTTMALLTIVVFAGTVGTFSVSRHNVADPGPYFHLVYVVFPRLFRTFLVMVPAAWGAYRGARRPSLSLASTMAGLLMLTCLTALASRGLEGSVVFGRGAIPAETGPDGFIGSEDDPRPLWPLSLLMMWPAAFIAATTGWRRWHDPDRRASA